MLRFQKLWRNHPTISGNDDLLDHSTYPNQCAVKMHACPERSGISLISFRGVRSWQKEKTRYAIRAQELANWLARPDILPSIRVNKFGGKEAFEIIDGRKGIIFFKNYWGPGHQGDHIDLWNGNRLTDWKSWARIHLNISWEGIWSDYRNSDAVWFWEVL
jgi:hypothetical protein